MARQARAAPRPLTGAALAGAALLAATAVATYWPALRGGWLWDDREDLPDNPFLRTANGLRHIWAGNAGPDYYPLKATAQWAEWQLWGGNTLPYHLVNLGLHIISAGLVWVLLGRFGVRRGFAFLGALLFLVHPIAVGSVAWIAELKDALSLPLLLAAAIAYVDFDRTGSWGRYALSLAAFVLAMLAKSSVMMFPFCLVLYCACAARSPRRWPLALPYLLVTVVLGAVAVHLQSARSLGAEGAGLGDLSSRIVLSAEIFLFYARHALWPAGVLPVYYRWPVAGGFRGALACWPWVGIVFLAACAWRRRRSWGAAVLLGGGWFVLHLAPVLGLVGISYLRFTWVMDHLAYVSLVGVAGLAAAGAQAWAGSSAVRLRCAAGALGAAALALAGISRGYARAYRGEEPLWAYAAQRDPSLWMPLSNLGVIRLNENRLPEAHRLLERAVQLGPLAPEAHRNLAVALAQEGRLDDAIAQIRTALRLRPRYALAEGDLGSFYVQKGDWAAALPPLRENVRLEPANAEARDRLGVALGRGGRPKEAIRQLQIAAQLAPDDGTVQLNLAILLGQAGLTAEALPHFETAARLMPGSAQARRDVQLAREVLRRGARP